ncbi:MAG: ATP-binding cassette domain-containing protein [Candidatus Eisenbacteria bacterium]|nr:ATP-binding cassette domain-containing protein [Candidatus Eisenbacteria bacterium]
MTWDLSVRNASVRFGTTVALDGVDLAIKAGESVALVGPSGSGKTTLLRLLGAVLSPTAGSVRIDGTDVAQRSPRDLRALRSRIGTVPQDLRLVPELRVYQNVAAGRVGRRSFLGLTRDLLFPAQATLTEIHTLLDRVGIEEKLYHRVDQLSGGQRQRVAVARALYQEPELLLADEPVSSVDPARARDALELLCKVAAEHHLTFVTSLHHIDLAREFFPRLVGVRRGRIEFDVRSEDVDEGAIERLYSLEADELLEEGATR